MPVEPGRFLSSRGASSEQQVNAGWQGPRLCNNYATLWRESFPAVDKAHFSDFVLRAQDGLHHHHDRECLGNQWPKSQIAKAAWEERGSALEFAPYSILHHTTGKVKTESGA